MKKIYLIILIIFIVLSVSYFVFLRYSALSEPVGSTPCPQTISDDIELIGILDVEAKFSKSETWTLTTSDIKYALGGKVYERKLDNKLSYINGKRIKATGQLMNHTS